MPIAFSDIPANWKIPLYWAEIDPSMAGYSTPRQPALLVGTMLPGGDAAPDVAQPIASQAQADARFGMGSELAKMFKAFFENNFSNEVWGCGVLPPVAAAAASGTLTVGAPPTESGTIHLYIGAEHVPVNIGSTDTEEEIADAIAEAINDREWLPVVASSPNVVPPSPPAPPFNASAPVIAMAPQEGVAAQVSNGTWTGNPPPTYTYAWESDTAGDGAFIPIAGETANSYTPQAGDVGNALRAQVTATNSQAPGASRRPATPATRSSRPSRAPVNTVPPVLSDTRGRSAADVHPLRMLPEDVTITCKWAGLSGNDIRISLNYFGSVGGQILPPGLEPDLTADRDADRRHRRSQTSPTPSPTSARRKSNIWRCPIPTPCRSAPGNSNSALATRAAGAGCASFTAASSRPGAELCRASSPSARPATGRRPRSWRFEMTSPSPAYEWAAAYCAKAQRALSNDPARPLQTLPLDGILLAPPDGRFIMSEINVLATYGLATQIRSADNVTPMISRETTTYQLNLYGFADDAYELVTTSEHVGGAVAQSALRHHHQIRAVQAGQRRHPVRPRPAGGDARHHQGRTGESSIASTCSTAFVEDIRAFKNNLIVERDANNPNRLNVLVPAGPHKPTEDFCRLGSIQAPVRSRIRLA